MDIYFVISGRIFKCPLSLVHTSKLYTLIPKLARDILEFKEIQVMIEHEVKIANSSVFAQAMSIFQPDKQMVNKSAEKNGKDEQIATNAIIIRPIFIYKKRLLSPDMTLEQAITFKSKDDSMMPMADVSGKTYKLIIVSCYEKNEDTFRYHAIYICITHVFLTF